MNTEINKLEDGDKDRPVTIWTHPNWDLKLILSSDHARFINHQKLARQYLGDDDSPALLLRWFGSRTQRELNDLREWGG